MVSAIRRGGAREDRGLDGLWVTLEIYRAAFVRGVKLAGANWIVCGTVFAYGLIMAGVLPLAVMLGLLGGFVIGAVWAACVSSFLYMVEMIVRTSRVSVDDFRRSFGAYLGDVLGVMFVLWVGGMAVEFATDALPDKELIRIAAQLLIVVFFNAVPELIYLGRHSSVELLAESYRFIAENWIEWFPPNLLLLAAWFELSRLPGDGWMLWLAKTAVLALFSYLMMVIRGLLFLELHGTTRRGRIFRHRASR